MPGTCRRKSDQMAVNEMRKLIVSINITLDGFMAGTQCELDWHFNSWSSRMAQAMGQQLSRADTILLGRVTYCAMARFWPAKIHDLSLPREDIALAGMMNSYKKIVFSKTLQNPVWNNSRIVKGNLQKEVLRLKATPGADMIVYGSGSLVSSLMQSGLVDEFSLWLHPVFLGKGKPVCNDLPDTLNMDLLRTETFSSGVIKMDLLPARRGSTGIFFT